MSPVPDNSAADYAEQLSALMDGELPDAEARFLLRRLETALDTHFASNDELSLPTVHSVAAQLNVSPSYLSDMLRSLTGQSAQQHIHSRLIETVKAATGNVLVVGHSNTLPGVIKALGITEPVSIAEEDYDNLFVVIRGEKPSLLRLHYR